MRMLVLLATAMCAAVPPPEGNRRGGAAGGELSPLLAVHAELTFRLVQTDRWHETLMVAHDGTTGGSLAHRHSIHPWRATTRTAKGSPARLAELGRALAAAQIGRRHGECALVARTGWGGSYEVVWFGAADRFTHLRVRIGPGVDDRGPPCPDSLRELIAAIERYAERVIGQAIAPDLRRPETLR